MTNRAVDAQAIGQNLAHDLSAWGLFLQADIIVKAVMLLLVLASVWCWAIIFDKIMVFGAVNKRAAKFEDSFWSGEQLDKLYDRVRQAKPDPIIRTFIAGMEEWRLGNADRQEGVTTIQASMNQRIERAMNVTIGREMVRMEKDMTVLANVGSAAPFIGLFGTVWGIMNSFAAIAGTQDTSLAVVAPGIAEALFATALGLVAAIPAVMAYNKFSSDLNRYHDRLEAFASEFSAILSRHLERQKQSDSSSHISNTKTVN